MDDIAEIAGKLSEAQRALVLASEPGGWGRDDTAVGVDLVGARYWNTARALERKVLGDIEEQPDFYPSGLYFNNQLGLAVRAHLNGE